MVALFGLNLKACGGGADHPTMNQTVSIGFSRRLVLALATLFAVIAVTGAWRAGVSHNGLQLLLVLLTFGGMSAAYGAQLLRRGPVLLLDDDGLTDVRRGVVVRWQEIKAAHVAEPRRSFDRYHDLVLTVTPEETLSLPLDQLTRKWSDVVALVEDHLGRQLPIQREGGSAHSVRARARC